MAIADDPCVTGDRPFLPSPTLNWGSIQVNKRGVLTHLGTCKVLGELQGCSLATEKVPSEPALSGIALSSQ